MKIKGAIFDMDGTLVDSLMFWDWLWAQIGEKYMGDKSFRPCDEVNRAVRTMIYTEATEYIRSYYNIPVTREEFFAFANGGTADFYRNEVKTKAGAVELLEYLRSKGIKICLASATQMSEIKTALECLDIQKYFDGVLSCADIGIGKDRPDIYLMARDLIGASEEDLCVFEDSFIALETAKRAGFQTVGIYDKYNFGQDRLEAASDIYVKDGESLAVLISSIE